MPAGRERLGDGDRVHDAAARAHGVGEHRDAQRRGAVGHGATARTASRAAAAFDGATITPAASSAAVWRRASCGSSSVPHTRATTSARSATRATAPRELARRVGVRAVAEDDVEQQAPEAVVGRRLLDHPDPQVEVDHRVRAPAACTPPRRGRAGGGPAPRVVAPGHVAGDRAERGLDDRRRLVGERAAGEEPEQRAGRRSGRARASTRGLERRDVGRGRAGGGEGGGLERVVDLVARVRVAEAHERGDRPLARRERVRQRRDDVRRRRLGDEQHGLGPLVLAEQRERLAEREAADRRRQVAAADADDVRHAAARGGDEARDLLRAGPRRGDDPDAPGRHVVGEPEADAAEHRRPAPRAHDEQAALAAAALERDLVLDGRRGRRTGRRAARGSARGAPRGSRTRRGPRRARRSRPPSARGGRAERARPGGAPRRRRRRPRRRAARRQHPLGLGERLARPGRRRRRPRSRRRPATRPPARRGRRAPRGSPGVPIATSHAAIPSRPRSARAMPISRTLSA